MRVGLAADRRLRLKKLLRELADSRHHLVDFGATRLVDDDADFVIPGARRRGGESSGASSATQASERVWRRTKSGRARPHHRPLLRRQGVRTMT